MKKNRLKYRFIIVVCLFFVLASNLSTYFFTFSEYVSKIASTETGVSGSTVTVNDLENDYNYYMGLNYTTSSDGSLPTIDNKEIYNENNLVELKISYYGYDISDEYHGYVSKSENQDTFIYYKMYPVNTSNTASLTDDYLEIELIDNPFTLRPNNMAFNGWTTDYVGAEISFYNDYYVRKVKIPVTYKNNVPNPIEISFYSNWKEAKVGYINSNNSWDNAFAALDEEGMQAIGGQAPIYEDVSGLYLRYTISFGTNYPSEAVDSNGDNLSGWCRNLFNSCTYYLELGEDTSYDPSKTYYKLTNNNMSTYTVSIVGYEDLEYLKEGTILSGYFSQEKISYRDSIDGYYAEDGTILSGTCATSSGCTYYKLHQYYDESNKINKAKNKTIYYYLANRDTNIIVMNGNVSTKWSSSNSKPFTLTGLYNGTSYIDVATWDISNQYITCYNDTVIENIKINSETNSSTSDPTSSASTNRYIYANYNNLKIGRGITNVDSRKTFNGVFGGNNATSAIGSEDDVIKYSLVVESGLYNTITLTNGPSNTNRTKYIEAKGIYGNDYDKAINNNDNLDVYFEVAGSWGAGNYYASKTTGITFDAIVKSGKFGTSKYDHTTGVYVGGRSYGTHYTSRRIKVEGGWIYNLIGGPLTASNREDINDSYINITGGEVDMVIGGAGTSTTYGNRVIQVTGGTVNYSVFGGSNSYSGSSSDGKLSGSSFVYVGGNAKIGNPQNLNSTLWGAESGSVFGIGNGNDSSSTIGTNKNSNIVIDGTAQILGNVYGGGNYSATGIGSSSSKTTTSIKIAGGTIHGSLYGGGNNNGAGSSSITSSININVLSGNIKGNVYGGSKNKGTVYGNVNVNLNGGVITGSVYGGGQGSDTKVSNNIEIISGESNSKTIPTVLTSIYGGSEYGTVNGTGTTSTSYKTTVTINDGDIKGAVFGGAKGDNSTTPYVLGDVIVNINGGTVNEVYGANDKAGMPLKDVNVYLNGGEINDVYGGGNETSLTTSNIYLKGSIVQNIYGGSNKAGDVTTSNIDVESGKAISIYGGNNIGGVTTTSNINLKNGTVTNVYGGGNKTSLETSNVDLNGATVENIYGGSNESGNVNNSNVTIKSGKATSIYGGNNIGGITTTTGVILNGGEVTNVYGGGKLTNTITSNITINDSNVSVVYGGGEEASVSTSAIIINGGEINEVFGGSNINGEVTKSNINLYDGNIDSIYGGNNIGGKTITSKINVMGANTKNLYGGGNNAPIDTTNVIVDSGVVLNLHGGGNNENGIAKNSNVTLNGGEVTNVYGGGNAANTDLAKIDLKGSTVTNLYGGGNQSGIDNTTINLISGNVQNVYGGSNKSGSVSKSKITNLEDETETNKPSSNIDMSFDYTVQNVDPSWQDSTYSIVATIKVTITNNSDKVINNYDGYIKINDSTLYSNYSATTLEENNSTYTFDDTNKYDSNNNNSIKPNSSYSFEFMVYSKMAKDEFEITEYSISSPDDDISTDTPQETDLKIINVYGGNNEGGVTDESDIILSKGEYTNIYGGGNKADLNTPNIDLESITVLGNIYGGGNEAIVRGNTDIFIKNSNIQGSIFGGGNAGVVSSDAYLYITNSKIGQSVYGGGNGATATVVGSSRVLIDDNTQVSKHVFGGGNAASIGIEEMSLSTSEVNIVGATIGGNVYGGGNTSVLHGKSEVNIGIENYDGEAKKSNIIINGTVFGGGEANEAGSENYDFSHISVTKGTTLNIDANGHDNFIINGSIFGSGNASSTEGESYINISNYGTSDNYKTNVSIQRADLVIVDNSQIELLGATDRTNEYSTVLFSVSRIKHLKLKNNSTLYFSNGANLLEEYTSAVDIDGEEVLATVEIEDNEITKNVNNRIFLLAGKNLNIATTENATTYGKVNGMSFFGMYTKDRNDLITTGLYSDNYKIGDTISNNDIYLFDIGSYILGFHKANHDITKDGFYSNFSKDGILESKYINPTPDDSTYYMWSIGEQVVTMELSLTASKYITLGAEELGMLNYSDPNTQFSIVGFNYNDLDPNVNLVEEKDVPRIAASTFDADNTMSLVMKSTNSGWITNGETSFLTNDNSIIGTTLYKSENTTDVPSFQFYLYHSKNLGTSGSMGSVTISFVVIKPIDEISNELQRVNLIVSLNRALYNTNDYEAAMTIGKEYDMFASTNVNLTTDGSLSAYYSLYTEGDESIYKDGYHRSLVSTYVFPVNTKLTMINLNENSVNEYYYYTVNENDYQEALKEYNLYGECSYDFSKFVRMGSTSSNNHFNDQLNNQKYYDSETGISFEEFIVIVDFIDSNITQNVLDKSLLIELRNKEDKTIVNVLGIEQEEMNYSLYANSNAVVDVIGSISSNDIYPGNSVKLNVKTNFNRKIVDSEVIHDTNYFDQQLGVKISYLDSDNKPVTGASLLGVTYEYDGVTYYPRMDGSVRINLAEKMANVSSNIIINTTDSVAAGNYTMVIESFGSADGIYYGEVSSDTETLKVNVLNTVYGLSMTMGDYMAMIDSKTGYNLNGNNDLRFNLKYSSSLLNPQLRISLYRRKYENVYSIDYELVDLKEYVKDQLKTTNKKYEYLLESAPLSDVTYTFKLKDQLKTGTYKLVVSLYDKNTYIGDVYKYLIIKERYNE